MAPPRQSYQQIPLLAFSEWASVGAVKAALNEMEVSGNFRSAVLLAEAMGRDDRITAVMAQRLDSLNGLPLEFEPADDSAKAQQVADDLKLVWEQMLPESTANQIREWGLWVQAGIGELNWDDCGADMWLPKVRFWNTQYAWWRWDTWSYFINTHSDGVIEMKPGVDGDRKWMIYSPSGIERGWMNGFVRSLATPWLIRQWAYRDWGRYSEIHGVPIRAGVVPPGGKEEHKERFLNELAALGQETVIRLEQGVDGDKFDLKLIEAVGNTWEGFEQLLHMVNTAIAVRLLGQNLTTEGGSQGSSGSMALGDIQDRVKTTILRSDASTFSRCTREQMLMPWALFNYGDADLAPKPKWKTDPPDDSDKKADTLNKVGTGIAALQAVGINVDIDAMATEYAIPTKPGKPPPPPAPKLPPGAKPADDDDDNIDDDDEQLEQQKGSRLKPHVEAQLFNDELADNAIDAARAAIRPDLVKVLACIEKAKDYPSLRLELRKAFASMTAAELTRVTRKALVLADLNGRHSVLEES